MSSSELFHKAFMSLYTGKNSGRIGLLAAVSVVSYAYSSVVLRLLDRIGWSLLASPQIAVCIAAICLLPQARARWSYTASGQDCNERKAGAGEQQPSSRRSSLDGGSRQQSSRLQSFRLAQPPFMADLSSGMTTSYTCNSSKQRRRRLPRISVELTPLPRLSLEFQSSCSSRRRLSTSSSCSSRSSLDGLSLGLSSSNSLQDSCHHGRWQPSMTRIRSGHNLELLGREQGSVFDAVDRGSVCRLLEPDSGSDCAASSSGEATESLGHSVLTPELQIVSETITETHLLQVGAMLGESSSRAALVAQEAGGPVNHPSSFYGSADTDEFLKSWDLLVTEATPGVLYWAWRRPLRKGLYMYMTRSVFLKATPAELRAFMNDDAYRVVWDNSMQVLRPLLSRSSSAAGSKGADSNAAVEAMAAAVAARTSGCSAPSSSASAGLQSPFTETTSSTEDELCSSSSRYETLSHENGILQAMVQFPKPMASRSYIYARRVWHRPSDGGCYCLARSCVYPDPLPLPGRAVAVEDYASGCVVRAPAQQLLPPGHVGPAAEVTLVYFEDSHVRPGLANMGVKKGLWPLVQRTDKALRVYQAGAAANIHLQPLATSSTPRLRRSMSTPSPGSLSKQGSVSISTGSSSSNSCGGLAPSMTCSATVAAVRTQEIAEVESGEEVTSRVISDDSAVHEAQPVQPAPEARPTSKGPHVAAACTPAAEVLTSACKDSKQSSGSSSSSSSSNINSKMAKHKNKGHGYWSWWSDVASAVGSALKGSAQLLAAVWQSHTRVALLVPTLEWKLLHWVVQRVATPSRLLLGAPPVSSAGAGSSGSSKPLQRVDSHPIGDWAHPGLLQRVVQHSKGSKGPSLLRVSSHPLKVEDLDALHSDGEAPAAAAPGGGLQEGCSCSLLTSHEYQEPLGSDWPSAAYSAVHNLHGMQAHKRSRLRCSAAASGDDSSSQCGSVGAVSSSCCCSQCVSSYPTSAGPSSCVSGSCRCCCHCGSCSTASSSRMGSSMCGSLRVTGGGRRQRRVIVRLMQAAGVRLAHKLISALEQPAAAATLD